MKWVDVANDYQRVTVHGARQSAAIVDICGSSRDGTMVVIEEFDRDHWAVGGTIITQREGNLAAARHLSKIFEGLDP